MKPRSASPSRTAAIAWSLLVAVIMTSGAVAPCRSAAACSDTNQRGMSCSATVRLATTLIRVRLSDRSEASPRPRVERRRAIDLPTRRRRLRPVSVANRVASGRPTPRRSEPPSTRSAPTPPAVSARTPDSRGTETTRPGDRHKDFERGQFGHASAERHDLSQRRRVGRR